MSNHLHVVMFSTGLSSAMVLKLVIDKYGKENVLALHTDTLFEDEDNYRFEQDVLRIMKPNFRRMCDGRTPSQVFFDTRYMVGPTGATCTRVLKKEQTRKFLKECKEPPILYFGIGPEEEHRTYNIERSYDGVECRFPLIEYDVTPEMTRKAIVEDLGIAPPRMYALGFDHANCGGRCVKAGHKHWKHLWQVWPERYLEMEAVEREFNEKIRPNTTILRKTEKGVKYKITLEEFRKRYCDGGQMEIGFETDPTPCECMY